jgi:hypothetical protein
MISGTELSHAGLLQQTTAPRLNKPYSSVYCVVSIGLDIVFSHTIMSSINYMRHSIFHYTIGLVDNVLHVGYCKCSKHI